MIPLFCLSACSPASLVAVEERRTIDPRVEAERIGGSRIRIVQPGDTLHAIAFANRLNVNKLAALNRLADTSRLNVGQRIRLTKPLNFVEPVARAKKAAAQSSESARPLNTKSISAKPLDGRAAADAVKPTTQQTSKQGALNAPDKQAVNRTPAQAAVALGNKPVTWSWPTDGKLIAYFSTKSGNQGIDIQGQLGQAVLAAGYGQVVYVGNGLKGYGNLVIIKHNDQFLSAYAHNQQLLVGEGELVNARQRIASLGKDNKQRHALHFQIRKEGLPVNPLTYLPKR